jgi:multidrug transporter EmrE-like cation transporter
VIGWSFLACTIVTSVAAQLSFKSYFQARRQRFVMAAAGLFVLAVVCTYEAVRSLGIGRVYVGAAFTYILAPVVAQHLFGERLVRGQYAALGLIAAGVIVYNL